MTRVDNIIPDSIIEDSVIIADNNIQDSFIIEDNIIGNTISEDNITEDNTLPRHHVLLGQKKVTVDIFLLLKFLPLPSTVESNKTVIDPI